MIALAVLSLAAAVPSLPTRFGERLCFLPAWKDAGPSIAIADPAGGGRGAVWVVDLTGALVTRLTEPEDGVYGDGLAGGRDLDGDGACDLVVGCSGEDGPGSVSLVSGRSGEVVWTIDTPPSPRATRLALIDDVDSDGLADVCVALPSARGFAGLVRVCRGKDGATLAELVGARDEGIGYEAVGIDDVNGDGIGDLALTSFGRNCVRIHALPGLEHLRDVERPDRERPGIFGTSLAAAPGVLLIGQPGAAFLVSTIDWRIERTFTGGESHGASAALLPPTEEGGAARVLVTRIGQGFDAGVVEVHDAALDAPLASIEDRTLTSGFGTCVVGIGDVDGDGEVDLAVSAGGFPGPKLQILSGKNGDVIRSIERSRLQAVAKAGDR